MRSLIASVCALLAVGCSSSLDEASTRTPLTVTRLRSEPFSFTYSSQLRQPERLVIRDQAAWVAAWSSLWPAFAPIPAPPNVDFRREMIVFVALGERPSGGYTILVDSAAASASGVTVWIGTSSPGLHCGTTLALTQPVDIARLPRIDAAVRFAETSKVVECK
jgi:hypothetical protein